MDTCVAESGMLFWKGTCGRPGVSTCRDCRGALCGRHAKRQGPGAFLCPSCDEAYDTDSDSSVDTSIDTTYSSSSSESSSGGWFSGGGAGGGASSGSDSGSIGGSDSSSSD
jgi:hypothetical protein